ncbi:1-aminocyclopropane-1-carboxylate oxidase-like 1 [Quillaja saponaria]|uniref:1-aminocyclopropane-1-carboxylate oxidase-like 1 n=1 Tax=Quillaja saponaria TaxID=32244 RepID=A0AAD7LBL4_QUISA|nr:1-aminocyclopropane-1-carboxylate oxidase-like 1 [Quillaja saponaria]
MSFQDVKHFLSSISMAETTADSAGQYDRAKALKQFDDSKIGVKGLVDSGINSIPRFFIHPPEILSDLKPTPESKNQILTIDLSGVDSPDHRSTIVNQIRKASADFGFFQIINHGIPLQVLDRTIDSFKTFHEQPTEIKAQIYGKETGTGVFFLSNSDLYHSKAASWRDALQVRLDPNVPDYSQIPQICRDQVIEWDREIQRLGEVLMGLLSEGLGLSSERLKEMNCLKRRVIVGQYYPYCPQPDLTVGIEPHSDPTVLTVLLQDHIGGLQVKCSEGWVDVKPTPGALVVNIGDLLQIISNEEYKSVEHRVLANSNREPRVSIAFFFNPSGLEDLYGPLSELTSPEKPPLYRHFTLNEFLKGFFTKEYGKSLANNFRQ